jgi:4-amino-4-deoxychorismate lyase
VFRTIAVRGGRILNRAWHFRRLQADCALLRLAAPEESVVAAEIAQVAPGEATVKVIVTRGAAGRGYAIPAAATPMRVVAAFPAPQRDPGRERDGVQVRKCDLILAEQPRLAGAKTLNRLENVMARSEWSDPAIAEGLLGDARGCAIEGTASNLFIVAGGIVSTPDLSRCGVVGAQRERVRELAASAGFECRVRDIAWDEVLAADEIFLTNSLIGVWPVASFAGRRRAPGPVARRLQALIAEHDARD